MGKSVMLTGAPVTGKSSISRNLRNEHGFLAAPDYTTRPIRSDEVPDIDKKFITACLFIDLFNKSKLIEPSLEYCNYQGNYYGSPVEWLDAESLGKQRILTCVAVNIADTIRKNNQDLVWVHLEAGDGERAQRLAARGISAAEIERRLVNAEGDSLQRPTNSDLVINTSEIEITQTVQLITEYAA